jgi:hypothetical protein
LPVKVLAEKPLKILILQDYPTAEIRYLKNFLSDRTHEITLRYQLSRNVYRYEYANTAQRRIDRLDTKLLNDFDLMIIDSDAFQKLSVMERRQLLESIRNGLGMIVHFNDVPSKVKGLKEFSSISFASMKQDTPYADVGRNKAVMLKTLGESVVSSPEIQATLKSNDGRVFSGYSSQGVGHVGFQLIAETYGFAAEGKSEVYSLLWSELLERTSRVHQHPFRIRVHSRDPIYVNEPVEVEIVSAFDVPSLKADGVSVPLTEDVLIDNRWLGTMWFNETGWHSLRIDQDSTGVDVFIHDKDSWVSRRVSNQQHENRIRQSLVGATNVNNAIAFAKPVPAWIFFISFLIAAGFLWLAPKL